MIIIVYQGQFLFDGMLLLVCLVMSDHFDNVGSCPVTSHSQFNQVNSADFKIDQFKFQFSSFYYKIVWPNVALSYNVYSLNTELCTLHPREMWLYRTVSTHSTQSCVHCTQGKCGSIVQCLLTQHRVVYTAPKGNVALSYNVYSLNTELCTLHPREMWLYRTMSTHSTQSCVHCTQGKCGSIVQCLLTQHRVVYTAPKCGSILQCLLTQHRVVYTAPKGNVALSYNVYSLNTELCTLHPREMWLYRTMSTHSTQSCVHCTQGKCGSIVQCLLTQHRVVYTAPKCGSILQCLLTQHRVVYTAPKGNVALSYNVYSLSTELCTLHPREMWLYRTMSTHSAQSCVHCTQAKCGSIVQCLLTQHRVVYTAPKGNVALSYSVYSLSTELCTLHPREMWLYHTVSTHSAQSCVHCTQGKCGSIVQCLLTQHRVVYTAPKGNVALSYSVYSLSTELCTLHPREMWLYHTVSTHSAQSCVHCTQGKCGSIVQCLLTQHRVVYTAPKGNVALSYSVYSLSTELCTLHPREMWLYHTVSTHSAQSCVHCTQGKCGSIVQCLLTQHRVVYTAPKCGSIVQCLLTQHRVVYTAPKGNGLHCCHCTTVDSMFILPCSILKNCRPTWKEFTTTPPQNTAITTT